MKIADAQKALVSGDRVAIVVGAGGGIGNAIVRRFIADPHLSRIIAISRNVETISPLLEDDDSGRLELIDCDYQEKSIATVAQTLQGYQGRVSFVCICNGVLHGKNYFPERRIEEFDSASFEQVLKVNTVIPLLWLKYLKPILKGKSKVSAAVLSARVGSIADNRLGGWYSYRSSKAALNMLLKTLSIEYLRTVKNLQLFAFHPGTTDTALSKPFQARVKEGKLFSVEFVAKQLYALLSDQEPPGAIRFVDWEHKEIAW